jgi:outer membrane protein
VKRTGLVFMLALLCAISAPLDAQEAQWWGRARIVSISPDEHSDTVADTGGRLAVGTLASIAADVSYRLTDRLGVEFMVTGSKPSLDLVGGTGGGIEAGSVWVAPISLSVVYYVPLFGSYLPYFGVGASYGVFFDPDASADLAQLGVVDMEFDGKLGFTACAGLNYHLSDRLVAHLDVRYMDLSAEVRPQGADADAFHRVDLDLDPWIIGLGAGWRF